MNIEEFQRSVTPKEIRVDDTDSLEVGMILIGYSEPVMIIEILDEMALGVIGIDEVIH